MIQTALMLLVGAGALVILFLVYCMFSALVYMFGELADDEETSGWD